VTEGWALGVAVAEEASKARGGGDGFCFTGAWRRTIALFTRGDPVADPEEPEIAVALKYSKATDNAPKVIAKGMWTKAEKILEIARKNGVPVMRNVPLAHALNRLEVGDEIPESLYDAVAEVLNYVFELARETDHR
jgi:flagellar biosynthetic protein FlhB/flagellar biosynthesis protein